MTRMLTAATLAALVSTGATAATLDATFTGLITFGDSLVDTGNIPDTPVPDVYYRAPDKIGRQFSNGPVLSDLLDDDFGGHAPGGAARSYAFGGARVGPGAPVPSYGEQIGLFLGDNAGANLGAAEPLFPGTPDFGDRPLVATWVGANDAFSLIGQVAGGTLSVDGALAGARAAAAGVAAGVQALTVAPDLDDFLVMTMPDLGRTPAAAGYPDPSLGTAIAQAFNETLGLSLAALEGDGTRITVFDTFTLLNGVLDDPAAYGFTEAGLPCVVGQGTTLVAGPCADPSSYVFWDAVHPTGAAHALLAGEVRALYPAGGDGGTGGPGGGMGPETPSQVPVAPALPLLAGGLGVLVLIRRRARA